MQKIITNVINNNFNVLIQKSGATVPQGKNLRLLGTQILKTGEVHLRKLKNSSKKTTAKKQGELFGNILEKVDIAPTVNNIVFSRFLKEVENDTVIAYDLTDEAHPHVDMQAEKGMENVSDIFDGSKRRREKGFVHHGVGTEKHLLRLEIHESKKKFLPQTRENILKEMIPPLKGKGIWAFDRGNDDQKLFQYLSEKKARFIVRIKENRKFCICDTGEEYTAKNLPEGRHEVYVRKSGGKKKGATDKLGYDTKQKYLVIKEKNLKKYAPIVLLTSISLGTFSNAELVKKYLERWGVENHFRRVKQMYGLENVLIRKWKRRINFTALILFVHFLTVVIQRKLEIGKEALQEVYLVAWESIKNFLRKESKSYNTYSFVAFIRAHFPKKLSFFLRTKNTVDQSIPTLFQFLS